MATYQNPPRTPRVGRCLELNPAYRKPTPENHGRAVHACSLPVGHMGPHRAHVFHDMDGSDFDAWFILIHEEPDPIIELNL